MILTGREQVNVDKDKIWQFITNPDNLSIYLRNAKNLKKIDENSFTFDVTLNIGFLKYTLHVTMIFEQKDPLKYIKLKGEAKGMGNYVNLTIELKIDEIEKNKNLIEWNSQIDLHGSLASLGNRYLDIVSQNTVNELFICLKNKVGGK